MSQQLAITLVIILATITIGASNFVKAPKNLTVPGSKTFAPFFCQHASADDILWKVNGSSLHQHLGSDVTACTSTLPNGQRLDKLKIKARPEFNTTTVICVAVFFNRTAEESHPATLTITETARQLPTGFAETPDSLVAAIGETAIFTCRHCTADEIDWQLNDTRVPNSNLPEGIRIDYVFPDDQISLFCGGVYSLVISYNVVLDYNQTMIRCEANIMDAPNEPSESASLLTQGPLGQVTDLRRNSSGNYEPVVYSWHPPYSLNVTNAEPDIAYCVRVYDITCPRQRTMTSKSCTVIEPTFSLTKNFGAEEIYEIEVGARTNLNVALNGTNFTTYRDTLVTFNSTVVKYNITILTHKHVQVQLHLQEIDSSSVIPNAIEVQLNDAYPPNGSVSRSNINCLGTLLSVNMSCAYFNLNCSMSLEIKQLFLSTVYIQTAAGCRINSSGENLIELSTHLVQNIGVSSTPNSILVSGELLNADTANITALGFLTIAYAKNYRTSLHYGIAVPRFKSPDVMQAEVVLSIPSVHDQEYRVSVFSIERDGLPFNRSVHLAASVANSNMSRDFISSTNSTPNVNASYEGDPGCVLCTFLDDSASSCVVIASNKSQSNSAKGITNIEVFNFPRREETAYGCINRSVSDLNVVAFAYDVILARIAGSGVAVELLMDNLTTNSTATQTVTDTTTNEFQLYSGTSAVLGSNSVLAIVSVVVPVILITAALTVTFSIAAIVIVKAKLNRALKIHSEMNEQNKSTTECEVLNSWKPSVDTRKFQKKE